MNNFDAETLIRAGRKIQEPFRLGIVRDDKQEDLIIRRIFRLLPGKRIVALAELDGSPILVKLFIGPGAYRYYKRELRGARAIESAGVPAARLRWEAKLASGGSGFLAAFDYLESTSKLMDVWQTLEAEQGRRLLLNRVIEVLARLHSAGVVQNDIHPENFLIDEKDNIYTIDGGDVSRRTTRPLSESRSLQNLALFFAQFHAVHDETALQVLDVYCDYRGWEADVKRAAVLAGKISRKRERRKADYISKAFRDCTRFACRTSFTRFTVCERRFDTPELQAILADLDNAISGGRLLKDGNTATVALIDSPVGRLVIKRYNIKSRSHRLRRLFRKSRAWISWANTLRLEFLGINTVKPVALVEERIGPLRGRAWFISEYIEGPDATGIGTREDPRADVCSIAALLNRLQEAGVSHGDLKASNFLLGKDGPVIIDLDSMVEYRDPQTRLKAQHRDIERFMKNWETDLVIGRQFASLLGQG